MEDYLRKNFAVEHKRPSEEALRRWRCAVSVVKNPRRRFRMVADLAKRAEADHKRRTLQEKLRVALCVQKAALHFIDAGKRAQHKLSEHVTKAGFGIGADELGFIVRSHDMKSFEDHGGVQGLAKKVLVSLTEGVAPTEIAVRQNIYGYNQFAEKPARSFWMFVWEALHDLTLIILMVCAVVSIGVGIATEGWPAGMYDGIGIVLCILLVVLVTALSDYKQSLQFKDLDKEKKNILVQVTRNGCRQKISIYDLVVGDIVHLSIGDQVPADGLLISGYSLCIDESSLSGESEPVNVTQQRPFLLSGTKVQDGSAKMLVTAVGMRTEWGRLMVTLSEGGEDETPLQVKLNGVATVIGKIGLVFSVVTFLVLTIRFLVTKALHGEIANWGINDALSLLNFFAIAVTIIVVAVPEGLPLAVTLSLAFAMKKLMNDKALVRHLSACETMGSATSICTDKTGTLTTNHMVVNKIWTCGKTIKIEGKKSEDVLRSSIAGGVFNILVQSIFQNTAAEVVKGSDGKNNILGSPTETAILEFGLLLGGDFKIHRKESEILKVEPFNSVKKKMSVLVSLSDNGGHRALCKGASEIILKSCNKIINAAGKAEPLSEEQKKRITDVINGFASEALRTLCLAFKEVEETSNVDSIPEDNYTLIAVIGIKDPVRPGVKEAVKTCLAAGITVRMVTGDNINTAKAIARECGILTDDGLAIEGPEFRDMSPEQMEETIPKLQVFNEINSRDMEKINVFRGIFSSGLFMMVMVSTVAFQSIIVEFLGTFANTLPLSWELWLASILLGAGSLIVAVILKCIPVERSKEAAATKHHDGYEPLPTGPDMA
ncbi:Cation-transporting P-type ATPase [Corchorus capsularis]|uniref:Calcium-transporting ATPase n=1 Tax=Corchorus capsularis TaxID=210143 RepID=A0A1R3GVI5_COCAP|nr:Cation-transporting P-type ATPase [Corchorus capsularis]